jgi:hypothetical protein
MDAVGREATAGTTGEERVYRDDEDVDTEPVDTEPVDTEIGNGRA